MTTSNCSARKTSEFLEDQEDQIISPKGNESCIFIGRMDAEAEVQYSGHLMGKADSLEKSLGKYFPKAGKA